MRKGIFITLAIKLLFKVFGTNFVYKLFKVKQSKEVELFMKEIIEKFHDSIKAQTIDEIQFFTPEKLNETIVYITKNNLIDKYKVDVRTFEKYSKSLFVFEPE